MVLLVNTKVQTKKTHRSIGHPHVPQYKNPSGPLIDNSAKSTEKDGLCSIPLLNHCIYIYIKDTSKELSHNE